MAKKPRGSRMTLKNFQPINDPEIRRTEYDGGSHIAVLVQSHGSVWPKVLPYCIANTLLTIAIVYLKKKNVVDLTMTSDCLSFVSLLVSFFVVSRANVIVHRYMEARSHLETLYQNATEIVHHAAVFTMYDQSEGAKRYRSRVAYKVIVLLRVAISALEHQSHADQSAWDLSVLSPEDRDVLKGAVEISEIGRYAKSASKHGVDDAFRTVFVIALELREAILSTRGGTYLQTPLRLNEERQILYGVDHFMTGFSELGKLVVADYPFALLQMSRTFLFFWIFSLPFALAGAYERPFDVCMVTFLMTYGFLGLEYVSIELDDPFGDDPNDFDDLKMAQLAFEDIYIALYKIDGKKAAYNLRDRVQGVAKYEQVM